MKVLCVERDIFQLGALKREVKRIVPDAHITACRRPSKAAELVKAEGCDVLLTEIELLADRLDGIRLAKAMREINPGVRIIFVTVCSEHEVARELSGLPVSGFLPKIWKSEELAATFQNLRCTAQ